MKLTKTIISKISLISFISLVSFVSLVSSCGGGGSDDLGAPQTAAVNNELVPITFNGSQGIESAVTRASGTPLSEKAQQFHVWGYKNMTSETPQKVFPGYQVDWVANTAYTTTSNTNNWEYVGISDQTIKYWDWGAQAYRFFAVTDVDVVTAGLNDPNDPNGPYKITMNTDATSTEAINALPYFSHLWFSTGNASLYPDKQFGKPVTLEFLKPLTRVRYIFKYVYPREGYFLTNKSFKPADGTTNIARKGTVTIIYPLTGTDTKESFATTRNDSPAVGEELTAFTVDYDPEDDGKDYVTLSSGAMTSDGWYIVTPNMSQGSYKLSVYINGVEKTAAVPANYMSWLPGYSYTYVFKITEEGGVEIGWVEYAVTPWEDMPADHTVYNW